MFRAAHDSDIMDVIDGAAFSCYFLHFDFLWNGGSSLNIRNEIVQRMIGINGSFMRIKAKIHIGIVDAMAIMMSSGSDLSIGVCEDYYSIGPDAAGVICTCYKYYVIIIGVI